MDDGEAGGSYRLEAPRSAVHSPPQNLSQLTFRRAAHGEIYYPMSRPAELNPCAGKNDGTSCGAGCVCKGGQWSGIRCSGSRRWELKYQNFEVGAVRFDD